MTQGGRRIAGGVVLRRGSRGAPEVVPVARRLRTAAACLATLVLGAAPAFAIPVTGRVVDPAGKPVEYANVAAPAHQISALTDSAGRFRIDLPPGPTQLQIDQIGYRPAALEVSVIEGLAPLRVTLAEEPVPVAEVVVTASSFGKSGKSEGAVVRRMDIVSTPGGAADVFQSLRALPGINAPDEGAALYVRGGDPRETLIRVDDGEIGHPYHYEGASGGLFSSFDTYMLKSAYFSSGGFSAKYGDVLSGVLDIQTQDPLGLKTVSVGANMAGVSASTSWALVPDRLSVIGSARFSAVDLLERVYGSSNQYVSVPSSRDGALRLLWRYSPTGRISALYLDSGDQVALVTNHLNYQGVYRQRSRNQFAGLQLHDAIGERLALHGHVGGQMFDTRWSFGPNTMVEDERDWHAGLDAVWAASTRHELSFGASVRNPDDAITGRTPADSTDYMPGAPTRLTRTRARLVATGVYVEDKLRVWGPLYATIGGRADHASVPGVWTTDPRASLAWRIDASQTLRLAAGRYHQLVDPEYLDPRYGNPELTPLESDHLIAGYEWKATSGNVRLEAYRKRYRDLVTQHADTWYANGGHGYARGVDVFAQGRRGRASGWVSYGFLDSRRMELDDPYPVPSSYGVRHAVTLVLQVAVTPKWQVGSRFGHSSGRPYTPVIGRFWDDTRDMWRPIEGENNSDRMPDYHRLDLRLTHLFSLPEGLALPASSVCVFYVEGMNVLGTQNVLDWVYNSDYSRRYADYSYFSRRTAVAGFSLTW